MKILIQKIHLRIRFFILYFCFFFLPAFVYSTEVLKVGYYPGSGFFNEAYEGGIKSGYGYGYEYIKMIANHGNFRYEFVYGSWPELMEKLINNEIDLLADVSYTPEREEKMLFPDYVMGSESAYIFTSKNNSKFDSKDVTTLNGARIGVSRYSTQIQDLENFIKENALNCQIILYDDDTKRMSDNEEGVIDASVELDINIVPDLTPLFKISSSDYYLAIAKSRPDLQQKLNVVLRDLYENVPNYNEELYKKYFSRILFSKKLSTKEKAWVGSHNKLTVGCLLHNLPFSDMDKEGNKKGALIDWFYSLKKELDLDNLEIEFAFYDDYTKLINALENKEFDIAFPIYNDIPSEETSNYLFSEPLTIVNMNLAYNSDSEQNITSNIAVPENSYYYNFAKDFFPESQITTYKTSEQCINAVTNKFVTSALMNEYKMMSLLFHNQTSFIIKTKSLPYTSEFCFATLRDESVIIDLINHGISVIPQENIMQSIVSNNAQAMMYDSKEFIWNHKEFLFIILILIIIIFISMTYVIKVRESYFQKNIQESELKNQIGGLLNKEQIYKNAINSGACGYYEVNLTQNLITSAVYEFVRNEMIDVSNMIHLPRPLKYTDLVNHVRTQKLYSNDEAFKKITSIEYLMQCYAEGNLTPDITYWALSPAGISRCHKQCFYLSKDFKTGNLVSIIILKDVTEEQKKEDELNRNHKIIEILASEYQSVYYIDINTQTVIPYSESGSSQSANEKFFKPDVKYSEAFKDFVENFVFKADQDKMLESGSIDNIMKKLDRQKSFVTNFRSYEKDSAEIPHYNEMKFVKVGDTPLPTAVILGFANKDMEIRIEQDRQQQLEAARKKAEIASEAKTKFLFNMSHDIRTPMNAIIGFTDMARKYKTDLKKVDECLSKISMASEHLLSLINDVLDMSRIESGKLSIEESAEKLAESQLEMIDILNKAAKDNGIELEYDFSKIRDNDVYFDKLHLNQIVLNVLSNAIKYTKKDGHVKYTIIQDENIDESTAVYQFIVEDNGIGMSEGFLQHVFEAFERERSSTVSRIQGTGLGLSITKSLIDLMDGTIDIESTLGKGTTVQFWLHFRIVEKIEKISHENSNAQNFSLKGKRILLVEDNELNREISRDLLEDEEVIIEEADDGSVAVEKVAAAPAGYYDYVLMDVQMPFMDGYKATEAIRSLADKEKASVPIVAVTANVFEEDKEKALKSGMDSHITKPIQFNVLMDTLSKLKR